MNVFLDSDIGLCQSSVRREIRQALVYDSSEDSIESLQDAFAALVDLLADKGVLNANDIRQFMPLDFLDFVKES